MERIRSKNYHDCQQLSKFKVTVMNYTKFLEQGKNFTFSRIVNSQFNNYNFMRILDKGAQGF